MEILPIEIPTQIRAHLFLPIKISFQKRIKIEIYYILLLFIIKYGLY